MNVFKEKMLFGFYISYLHNTGWANSQTEENHHEILVWRQLNLWHPVRPCPIRSIIAHEAALMLRLPPHCQEVGPLRIKKPKMSHAGRPKDEIWQEFTKFKQGKRDRARCRKCLKEMEVIDVLVLCWTCIDTSNYSKFWLLDSIIEPN